MQIPSALAALLRLQRPHGGQGEQLASAIVQQAIRHAGYTFTLDRHGNISAQVGDDVGVVFAAHLDTVHTRDGKLSLCMVEHTHELMAEDEAGKPAVLGADDAAGVYLLVHMIQNHIPGRYLFFVGEEVGGVGSSAFVRDNPTFSANAIISFDRRGTDDIITHQGWTETASEGFAQALADQLNLHGFKYAPSDGGIYTDSKEFSHIVPECTNISVGYYNEHRTNEYLDLEHLLKLADAVLQVQWSDLPILRTPVDDVPWETSFFSGFGISPSRQKLAQEAKDIRRDFNSDNLSTYRLNKFLIDIQNYLEA